MASIVDKAVTINSSETLTVGYFLSQVNELGGECSANFAASKPCDTTEFLYNAVPGTYDYEVDVFFMAANDNQFYFSSSYDGGGGFYTFSTGESNVQNNISIFTPSFYLNIYNINYQQVYLNMSVVT